MTTWMLVLSLLTVSASPQVQLWRKDAQVVITVRVDKHADNRLLRVEVEGPTSRAWDEQLDGEDAPRTRQRTLSNLYPGSYTVKATVKRADDTTKSTLTTFEMKGAGGMKIVSTIKKLTTVTLELEDDEVRALHSLTGCIAGGGEGGLRLYPSSGMIKTDPGRVRIITDKFYTILDQALKS